MEARSPVRIGIIAGGGNLPLEIARSVEGRGGFVHVVMIEGQALPALRAFSHTDASWAEVGKAVKAFKRAGVSEIVMVGRMTRPRFKTAKPDFGFLRVLPSVIRIFRAGGDDAVLRAVIDMFERRGLKVRGVGDVAPELLVSDGAMTDNAPMPADAADIARGFDVVRALGKHDIGQAVVVTDGRIEALEAAEGTDRMIERVAERRRNASGDPLIRSRGVLVKRPKPGQDLRVDLPAIGPDTVQRVADARLSGIAAMSGHVLAASRFELVKAAERERVFVVGVPDARATVLRHDGGDAEPMIFGRIDPMAALKGDMQRGIRIMSTLAEFGIGTAVVIRKGRVLAIGTDESPREVIERAASIYKPSRRRSGIVLIGHREALDEQIVEAASDAGLEGLIFMYGREDRPQHKGGIVARADERGVFIAGGVVAVLEPA